MPHDNLISNESGLGPELCGDLDNCGHKIFRRIPDQRKLDHWPSASGSDEEPIFKLAVFNHPNDCSSERADRHFGEFCPAGVSLKELGQLADRTGARQLEVEAPRGRFNG